MRLSSTLLVVGTCWLLGTMAVFAAPPPPPPPLDTGDTADTAVIDDTGAPDDTADTSDTDDTGPDDTADTSDTDPGDTAEPEDTSVYVGAAGLAGELGGCGCASTPSSAAFGASLWLLGLALVRRERRAGR